MKTSYENTEYWIESAKDHAMKAAVLIERMEVDDEVIDLDLVIAHALTAIALNITHQRKKGEDQR